MSSLFSDPQWRRGSTLLNGELIEYSDAPTNSKPIAGTEVVGQIKAFIDANPSSGKRNSNRLVYCVAARYTGNSDLTSADAGKAFKFTAGAALSEFSAVATATDVNTTGLTFGVLDEYLTENVRKNDIVWLVVKGPCTIKKKTGSTVASGVPVQIIDTAGEATSWSSGEKIGTHLGAATAASGDTTMRINLFGDSVTGA